VANDPSIANRVNAVLEMWCPRECGFDQNNFIRKLVRAFITLSVLTFYGVTIVTMTYMTETNPGFSAGIGKISGHMAESLYSGSGSALLRNSFLPKFELPWSA